MLGIVIGNASVITLVGVGRGAQNLAENQLSNLGANVLFVVPGNNDTRRRGVAFPKNLVLKDAIAIEQQVPTVKRVAPQISSNEVIQIGAKSTSSSISGVTSDFLIVRSFEIAKGRFINDQDTKGAKSVVVIGPDLEEKLFNEGEGLGNQFLGNIRETDAILHVVRCFDDGNIVHVDGSVDPVRDKETIDIELQLKDLETVQKRVEKSKKVAKSGDKDAKKQVELFEKVVATLEQGKSVRTIEFSEDEQLLVNELNLITSKPVMYVCNVDEAALKGGNDYVNQIKAIAKEEKAGVIMVSAQLEADIAELDDYEERQLFLEDAGLKEPGVNKLIREAYSLLNLSTYFTAGEKEVRAWTIKVGMTAPQAAGVIHTDFEKGFIRAEVIKYDDYVEYGSESACKEAGKLSVEGKDYVVENGDVMHFRFNV